MWGFWVKLFYFNNKEVKKMVTTMEQARRIQKNRVNSGVLGHAPAVRRFLKRGLDLNLDLSVYCSLKTELPHLGRFPN